MALWVQNRVGHESKTYGLPYPHPPRTGPNSGSPSIPPRPTHTMLSMVCELCSGVNIEHRGCEWREVWVMI